MIEIKSLYKRYHNHHSNEWVLRDINITIPTGVSVGLIGANGAGKSTLLRLIAGIDTPDRGEVIRHSRVSWPVGLAGGMQGSLTGRQNVKFVARAQGFTHSSDIERIVDYVKKFSEIGSAFDDPVKTYSSGMKSRVSFGLSLAFDFDIFISDEATSVGDRAFKQKAQAVFKEKVSTSSLIIVSHGEAILKELCSAGIYVKDGSAIWYNDIKRALDQYHSDIGFRSNKESIATKRNRNNRKEISQNQKNKQISKKQLVSIRMALKELKEADVEPNLYSLAKDLESFWYKKSLQDEHIFRNSYEGKIFYQEQYSNKIKNILISLEKSKSILSIASPENNSTDIERLKDIFKNFDQEGL